MKKILIFIMTAIFIFTSAAATPTTYFDDTNEHWAEDDIEELHSIGIMLGNGESAVTDSNVTRAEFAAFASRAFAEVDGNNYTQYFDDVPSGSVFAPFVAAAYEAGLINGVGDGKFAPDSYVTREQIAIMISRINSLPNKSQSVKFSDIKSNYKYMAELKKAVGNGIINGYDDGKFYPYRNATRAQAASMIMRALRAAEANTDGARQLARESVSRYFADIDYIIRNSVGSAQSDANSRLALQSGDVTAEVTDIKEKSSSAQGALTQAEFTLSVRYASASYTRNMQAAAVCKVITKGAKNYVYDINIRLAEDGDISLAWDISAQKPTSLPDGLTHISPSAYILSADNQYGTAVNIGLPKIKLYNMLNDGYVTAAHTAGKKVWAMYKTDFKTATANSFLHDDAAMKAAIEYLRAECVRTGISGINLDFENMYATDAAAYANHVHNLTLVMHDIGVIVSADITRYEKTSATWSMCYDRDRLAQSSDYIMIMAYDQYYAGSKTAGPVAAMNWTEDTIKLTLKEVSADKLILGVPFYVRYWESKNNTVTSTKAISMQAAQTLADNNNAAVTYSIADGLYIASWQKNSTECKMWLENSQSIDKRKDLARKYGLAGTAAWRLGLETDDVWQ